MPKVCLDRHIISWSLSHLCDLDNFNVCAWEGVSFVPLACKFEENLFGVYECKVD